MMLKIIIFPPIAEILFYLCICNQEKGAYAMPWECSGCIPRPPDLCLPPVEGSVANPACPRGFLLEMGGNAFLECSLFTVHD